MIAAGRLPRLLASEAGSPTSLDQHLQRFGELTWSGDLTSELERAGLTGRGGAGFPTWRKVQLLRQQRAGK
jgi:NADH:ubiquinone oxidoreductase subunit F (NADH-binding)